MDRGEDGDERGPGGLEPRGGASPVVRRAVVENPKDAGPPHIPGRQVCQGPAALVFMLDPPDAPRGGRPRRVRRWRA